MILPPTSQISHHHKVTNITMSPTSLSPYSSYHKIKSHAIFGILWYRYGFKITLPVWRNRWKLSLTPTVFLSIVHCSNIFGQSDLFAAIDFNSDDDWAFPSLFLKIKIIRILGLLFEPKNSGVEPKNKPFLRRCVIEFNESISLWWCIHNRWCWCWFWLEILPCTLFVRMSSLWLWDWYSRDQKFIFEQALKSNVSICEQAARRFIFPLNWRPRATIGKLWVTVKSSSVKVWQKTWERVIFLIALNVSLVEHYLI